MAKNTTLKVRNRLCRKTKAQWEEENPVLLAGEVGYDLTSRRYKIGDGSTAWNKLKYQIDTAVLSAGQQLVVNGTGIMGDNTNFSSLTYDPTMSFSGSAGVFKSKAGAYTEITSDEFIPISAGKTYRMSESIQSVPEKNSTHNYIYLNFYDADKYEITAKNHMYFSGSTTTLAKDLKVGDTEVYVTDLSGFKHKSQTYARAIIFWDYKNSFGYQYPKETYSRRYNANLWTNESQLDYTNNKIILDKPWSSVEHLAGCSLSQGNDGRTYKYLVGSNVTTLTSWSSKISGVDYSGQNKLNMFPPGVAYAKCGFLLNYNRIADTQVAIGNIRVEEVSDELTGKLTLFKSSTKTPVYNGSADVTITPSDVVGAMDDGTADINDKTEFITSNVNGFNYSGSVNVPYRRKATYVWNWIKRKIESVIKPIVHRGSNTYVYSGDDSAKYSRQAWVNCLPFTDSEGETRYALEILPNTSDTITYNGKTHTITNSRSTTIFVVLYNRDANIVQDTSGTRAKMKFRNKRLIAYITTTYDIDQSNDGYDIMQFYVSYTDKRFHKDNKSQSAVLVWYKTANNSYSSNSSVASGYSSVASGNSSVASGSYSVASDSYSVASGYYSVASGESSIAMGAISQAKVLDSIAFGRGTIASTRYQAVFGTYNKETNDIFIIGYGSSSTPKNIFTISTSGKVIANSGYAIPEGTSSMLLLGDGSHNTLKTIGSQSLLGTGDIELKTINNTSIIGTGDISTKQYDVCVSDYQTVDTGSNTAFLIPFIRPDVVGNQEYNDDIRLLSTNNIDDISTKLYYVPETNTISANIGGWNKLIVSDTESMELEDVYNFFANDKDNLLTDCSRNTLWLNTLCDRKKPTKSIATMISDSIAEIVADAPASFDTLKEIADWISSHADSASAMNTAIQTNTANIASLTTQVGNNTTRIEDVANKLSDTADDLQTQVTANTTFVTEFNELLGQFYGGEEIANKGIQGLYDWVQSIYTKADNATSAVNTLEANFNGLKGDVTDNTTGITTLKEKMTNAETSITELQTQVDTNTTDITSLTKQVTAIEGYERAVVTSCIKGSTYTISGQSNRGFDFIQVFNAVVSLTTTFVDIDWNDKNKVTYWNRPITFKFLSFSELNTSFKFRCRNCPSSPNVIARYNNTTMAGSQYVSYSSSTKIATLTLPVKGYYTYVEILPYYGTITSNNSCNVTATPVFFITIESNPTPTASDEMPIEEVTTI